MRSPKNAQRLLSSLAPAREGRVVEHKLAREGTAADDIDRTLPKQTQDRKTPRRINTLIEDILRDDPFTGIGKPEALKHVLAGAWSRRIDEANRLVYIADDHYVTILQARYHY